MAITFVAKGTFGAGTTSITPGIPSGMTAGGFMLLTVHTTNQVVSAITGWTAVTSTPVGTGTAGAAGGTRVSTYYRFWQSGDAAPTVTVTGGNCTNGIIAGYKGVDPTTPFNGVTPVATTLATASTTLTMTGLTTASANDLIFWSVARDIDATSTTGVTAFVNANLTGITEVHDETVITGPGGGIWVGHGFKGTAGATGNLTITQTSSIAVGVTIALNPDLSVTAAITGAVATGQSGTAGVSETKSILGELTTAFVNTVTSNAVIATTGNQATGQAGDAAIAITVSVIGVSATGEVGNVDSPPTNVDSPPTNVDIAGVLATGDVGSLTASIIPVIIIDDTHDGGKKKRKKYKQDELKRRKQIVDAYEILVEGKPEQIKQIVKPYTNIIVNSDYKVKMIVDFDKMMRDLNTVEKVLDAYIELDDEEILALL